MFRVRGLFSTVVKTSAAHSAAYVTTSTQHVSRNNVNLDPKHLIEEGNDSALEYEVLYARQENLPDAKVLELVDIACDKGDARAINILAQKYPTVVDAPLVSAKLSENKGGEVLSYNLLEESAKHNIAPSLKSLFTETTERDVTKVFGSEDAPKLHHYLTNLQKTACQPGQDDDASGAAAVVGSFLLRNAEPHDAVTARFCVYSNPTHTSIEVSPQDENAREMKRTGVLTSSHAILFPHHYNVAKQVQSQKESTASKPTSFW